MASQGTMVMATIVLAAVGWFTATPLSAAGELNGMILDCPQEGVRSILEAWGPMLVYCSATT